MTEKKSNNLDRIEIAFGLGLLLVLMVLSINFWDISKWLSIPILILSIRYMWDDFSEDNELILISRLIYPITVWNILVWFSTLTESIGILIFVGIVLFAFSIRLNQDRELIGVIPIVSILYGITTLFVNQYGLLASIGIPILISGLWYLISQIVDDSENDYAESFLYLPFVIFGLIVLLSFLFDDSSKTKTYTPIQIEKEEEVEKRIKEEELIIEKKVISHFDSLKRVGEIRSDVNPEFKLTNVIDNEKRILEAEYSYTTTYGFETTNEVLQTEVTDYLPGKYHIRDSPAAFAILQMVDRTINRFLRENLEQGEEIQIELHGFTDSLKFDPNNPTIYDGREGDFPKDATTTERKIDDYTLNGNRIEINLKKGDAINNETLGFLRAYCMKVEYIDDIVLLRNLKKKSQYTYHATTSSTNSGEKYRKVKIKISIVNPQTLPPAPIPEESRDCTFLSKLILFFLGLVLGSYALFHYKRIHEKKDENKPYEPDLIKFIVAIILGIILLWLAWWLCPELFNFL
jgi:hypothetical protein